MSDALVFVMVCLGNQIVEIARVPLHSLTSLISQNRYQCHLLLTVFPLPLP